MSKTGLLFGCVVCLATVVCASEIDGTIVVHRRLSKKKVTPSASVYSRGTAVELKSTDESDPLAFERSRVVIYLEGNLPLKGPASAEIRQKGRQFLPDTLVIPAGSTVSFPNLDPIFHNVFSLSKPKLFDLGNYPMNQTRTVTFPKPGVVFVHCRLHSNMSAAIVVTPNSWATQADESGKFEFGTVPPGRYTAVAWHKTAGFFRQEITVTADRKLSIQFLIPLDAEPSTKTLAGR
jgi:Polysaccharide lyase family 4, domain II